jgi:uracil-DNA glycosylase family 4
MIFKSDFDCQSVDCSPDVNCLKCGLYKNKRHPKQNYTGEGKLKCLICAEAPGESEDLTGKQLVGDVGKWFRRKLAGFGLSLDRDFWKMNAVSCRPTDNQGNNRKPTPQEIQYCRARILSTIKELKPRFIWLMGNTAIESFYADHYDSELLTIGKWRRNCIPDPEYGAYILPMWHPSYLTRNERDQNLQSVYTHDLMYAVGKFDLSPFEPLHPKIYTSEDFISINKKISAVIEEKPKLLYFDYETNCLKPQLRGSKVVTISFCCSDGGAFAFPYERANIFTLSERQEIKRLWSQVLADPDIGKAAHSCQFENNWSCKHFTEPKGWFWDTQLTAHILDNRRSVYGLKFQAYLKLGIKPYDKEIEPYLKADGKNTFNDIDKAPLGKLLTYNAMDTFCGWHLKHSQVGELIADRRAGGRLYEASKFFLEGAIALSDMERAGIRTDPQYYKVQKFKIEQQIEETKKLILVDPLAVKFRKMTGRPMGIKKNVGAEDLRYLLENVMKVKIEKLTATELTSTDSEVLTRLKDKHSIIQNIINLRGSTQLLKTYIMGYLDWAVDGYIYPQFGLQVPTSYRSSARNPNIQNVPKRNVEIRELIRKGILPRVGRQLGEMDFSGIEVAVGCCYHKDPQMISYLTKGGDMHRDAGADVWILPATEITKLIRFFLKNQYVFPEFYGSTFHNCSRGLWETSIDLLTTSGEPLREHMRVKGIKTLNDFTDHLKDCENKLWHRFRVYKRWKDNQEIIYRKQGYIETFLGFKFTDYMGYNELSNYPVQGTAFHVLLWTYIQINKVRRAEEWRTKIPAEVHDSMMFDFHPKEVAHVIKTGKHIAEVETRKAFEWINIPIKIETELAPVGGSWNDLKPYEV